MLCWQYRAKVVVKCIRRLSKVANDSELHDEFNQRNQDMSCGMINNKRVSINPDTAKCGISKALIPVLHVKSS